MIKVAVTGAAGRMGSGIIRKITQQDDMEVVAAIEIPNSPLAGVDVGIQAGAGELGVKIVGAEKLEETLKESKADVLVDFTIAHAAVETVKKATACGVNVVVGTTGFTDEQMAENIKNVKDNDVKAVISQFYPQIKREIQNSWERLFDDTILMGSDAKYGNVWELKREWLTDVIR